MGISSRKNLYASLKTCFADAKSVLTAKSEASVPQYMSLAYYISIESMCDVLEMPNAMDKRFRNMLVEGCIKSANEVARAEVMGKEKLVNVLYFPIPIVVAACWNRPEVDHIRTQTLYSDDMRWRGNAEEKKKTFWTKPKSRLALWTTSSSCSRCEQAKGPLQPAGGHHRAEVLGVVCHAAASYAGPQRFASVLHGLRRRGPQSLGSSQRLLVARARVLAGKGVRELQQRKVRGGELHNAAGLALGLRVFDVPELRREHGPAPRAVGLD
jgi:hypothetical protein